MNSIKYINYDADNKNDFDFKSIIHEEIHHRGFENKAEMIELREKAFDGYRDRYLLVVQDHLVIGYLIYGNDKLFKSSIIKFYFFYDGYKDDWYIKQVILEFLSRQSISSACMLHEPDCDVLIQLGFQQSNLMYEGMFCMYFYDEDMMKIGDFLPFIQQKSDESLGSYYYRKMDIIQKLHFILLMVGLFSGGFIFAGIIYILETVFTSEPLTIAGIILVSLDLLIAVISIPCYFSMKSKAKSIINFDLRASGFRVKDEYDRMFL